MPCKNADIKELLPSYVGEKLDEAGLSMVEGHLATCADCAQEAALLRMMVIEAVPDPGDLFWSQMPERVHRAVRQQNQKGPRRGLSEILHDTVLPRWAWAAAAAGVVLAVALLIGNPLQRHHAAPAAPGYEYAYDDISGHDPVLRHTSATIADLTSSELDSVDAWAATELSAIALEAGTNIMNASESDLSEELAGLNAQEADRLSTMLKEPGEEG
jgi:anti-sigma factor RsiW